VKSIWWKCTLYSTRWIPNWKILFLSIHVYIKLYFTINYYTDFRGDWYKTDFACLMLMDKLLIGALSRGRLSFLYFWFWTFCMCIAGYVNYKWCLDVFLTRVRSDHPGLYWIHFNMGEISRLQSNYESALDYYNRTLNIDLYTSKSLLFTAVLARSSPLEKDMLKRSVSIKTGTTRKFS
jgi:hypothetical protein